MGLFPRSDPGTMEIGTILLNEREILEPNEGIRGWDHGKPRAMSFYSKATPRTGVKCAPARVTLSSRAGHRPASPGRVS